MSCSRYNIYIGESILKDAIMSKKNLKSASDSHSKLVKARNQLPYNQPKLYCIGALLQVKGSHCGDHIDASGRYYNC